MQMKNYFNLKKSKLLLLTLLTMLVVGARPAWAQKSMPYSYGFEDNNLATDGWTTQNPSGRNNHEFGINSYARKTGSYGFRFSSLVENGENTQYLISPELNASREIELTFEYRGSDVRASEKFKVGYSTTNTDIASFTFDGDEYTANDDSWATFRGNFPAGTKYIAVYYYTDGKYQLYVDDFSFKLACPAPTNLTATNVTPTSATLNWEGKAESYNVRYRKLVFFDDFENGLGNWTTYTMGDAAAWGTEDPKILGLSGHNSSTNVAFSLSWDDGVSYHADNWLVTPQVQLGGTLKFYVYTNQSYPDAYEVKLSTGGNTIDDFTVTLQELASIPTTGDWVEVNIDLSSYEGQSGYIAIHHSFYDGNYILVDDFSIYPPQEAGEWIEATSTTNSFDITGLTPGTTYEFQVRANYGSEDGLSQWSAVATFTVNYPWAGSGTADDPFQIQNVDDWNTLAANVTEGETYSGIYFKMTDDIIGVTTRTGKNSLNPFSGTFDGQGHTMNLNIYSTTTADVTSAPFGSIRGATIKNLHVTGSETTTAYMRAASIAGFAANSTITNCWSEVALTSGYNKDIDCGAFVATVIENSSLTLNGCLFTGTITYTNAAGYEGGGMVGYTRSGSTATLNDCLFAPASFTVTKYSGHYMFVGGKKRGVLNNCYYNDVAAATSLVKEGKQAFSIVKGDDVSSLAISGEGTEYSVSGITAYATGIKYNDVYYAGSGEAVGLTLSHADREGYTFSTYAVTGGGGTLADATTDTPTLTMSEADAVVSAMWLLPTDETGAYLISSAGDWNSFCYDVNNGNAYSGKTVKLTQDISEAVNTTAGTSETLSFQGTFDGQAHTLNVDITDNSNSPAPFRYIKNATIRNLVVTGNITSSQKHVAGLAKATYGDILIENCNVAATISGARYMGGFIGHSQAAQVTINGCVFSGTLSPTGSDYTGGFICWGEGVTGNTMAVTNSLFCGTLAGSGSSKFHPIGFNYTPANPTRVFTNTYYTIAAKNIDEDTDAKSFVNGLDAESKGKQAYALATAPANLGDLVQDFGVMTAYENGILCGDIYYVAPADITLNETEAGEVTAVDGYFSNVTLKRTLQTGGWNTFCAPFSTETPSGWTVKELSSSAFDSSTGELTLNFGNAASIEAGKPYLVKVDANVANPTFNGVTISSTTTTTETTAVDFVPVMNPTNLTGGDKTVLFITGGNKLTYPSGDGNINGFRAYFQLKGESVSLARAFRMSFDDNVTGITTVISDEPTTASGTYTLDGRRIEGEPTQKGMYIVNGKKVIK